MSTEGYKPTPEEERKAWDSMHKIERSATSNRMGLSEEEKILVN